jgi:hypothetical protein
MRGRGPARPRTAGDGVALQSPARLVDRLSISGPVPRVPPRTTRPPPLVSRSRLCSPVPAGHGGVESGGPVAGCCGRPARRRPGAAPRPPSVRVARATRGRWPRGSCANETQVPRWSVGLARPGASRPPDPPQGDPSWRVRSTPWPPLRYSGPGPRPPGDRPTRSGVGPSALDGLDGRGAWGGSRRRCQRGAGETARGAAGDRGGPGPGPQLRRWRLRPRADRRTTGLAPAARGRPRPRVPGRGPRQRPGLAAAPVGATAPPPNGVRRGRPAPPDLPPPPAG